MRFRILALLAAFLLPLPLKADTINFSLSTPENNASTPPPGSVLVSVDRTSSTVATITFTSVSPYFMNEVFFKVNGAFTTVPLSGFVETTGGSLDSFGSMSEEVRTGGAPASTISVTIDATGGNSWANALSVLTPSTNFGGQYPQGFEALAQIGTNSREGTPDNLGIGGFAPAATPEPGSLVMVGTGILTAAGFLRRRVRKA
jgi:hypothetical protein